MRSDFEDCMDGAGVALCVVMIVYLYIGIIHLIVYIYDNRDVIADNIKYYAARCAEFFGILRGYVMELISQVEIGDN